MITSYGFPARVFFAGERALKPASRPRPLALKRDQLDRWPVDVMSLDQTNDRCPLSARYQPGSVPSHLRPIVLWRTLALSTNGPTPCRPYDRYGVKLHALQRAENLSRAKFMCKFASIYSYSLFLHANTTFPLSRFKPRFSAVLRTFYRRKAAVVLRKVAEGLRFDCGPCGSFTVFAVSPVFAVFCSCIEPHRTAVWIA